MVPFGLQLGDDDDRQDHLVLVEASDGGRIGEQDAGVEYIRTATLRIDHADSPGRQGQPGAKTGHRRVGWAGPGPQRAAPALLSSRLHAKREAQRFEGPPGNGTAPSTTTEGTRDRVAAKALPGYQPTIVCLTCGNVLILEFRGGS